MEDTNNFGMTIKGLLLRIILIVGFVFLLIWLFPMPDLTPLNNQIFADNIDRMKDVARTYYTVERLPQSINESKSLTLREMIDQNMILPLMDSNGKYCNEDKSYIQITKYENEYVIKAYLSCSDKTDYVIEHFGCYDICSDKCKPSSTVVTSKKTYTTKKQNTTTTKKKVTTTKNNGIYEYKFSKDNCSQKLDKYTCPSGYTLTGTKCIKNNASVVTHNAEPKNTTVTSTDKKNSVAYLKTTTSNVSAVKTVKNTTLSATKTATTTKKGAVVVKKASYVTYKVVEKFDVITATKIATTKWAYDYTLVSSKGGLAYTNDTEKLVRVEAWQEPTCSTCFTYVDRYKYYHYSKSTTYSYNCDKFAGYSLYNTKYCRKSLGTEKSCPSGYVDTGSNCKKEEIVGYNCDKYGKDYTLSNDKKYCTKTTYSYSCPKGTPKAGDNTKCVVSEEAYSCPAGTTKTNDPKVCKKTKQDVIYSCDKYGKDYKLSSDNKTCTKTTTTNKTVYSCDKYGKGFVLNGTKCVKTVNSTDTKNATANYKTTCKKEYKWSTSPSLNGWTYTGEKRLLTK